MANTTIKITQLPSIGNGLSATTILPVVDTTGTAITAKVAVGNVGNLILTEAGNTLEPAFLSTLAYSVANAAQPNITSVGTLSVSTLKISGGDNGYVLQTDGAGNLAWVAGGGSGNGEVGGANTQIQFNDAGNFGGDPELTWDAGNNKLITANLSASGNANVGNVNTVNVNATGNLRPNAIYTDNYFYANGYVFGGGGNGTPGGANTQVQFNDNGAFAGQGNFTYDAGNNILNVIRANVSYLTAYTSIIGGNSVTANYFIGSGANLTNIAGANISGFVSNANVANTAFAVAAANVIGLGNIATLSLDGSTSNVLYGNGVFAPSGSGTPAGSNTQIQFNNAGSFGSDSNFTYDISTDTLLVPNITGPSNANLYVSSDNGNLTWIFGKGGALVWPGNGDHAIEPNIDEEFEIHSHNNVVISTDTANANAHFTFDTEGKLHFNDGSAIGDVDGPNTFGIQSVSNSSTVLITGDGANTFTWNFGPDGNLTLPGNAFAVNYANGTQVSIGGSGNTGNVTFDDNIVIGTGDEYGGAGLFLATGPNGVANLQYLQVRGGDFPTHIHLDTGNNAFYDQYFGADSRYVKLEANGNVVINADDYAGNGATWTLDTTGNLSLPAGGSIYSEGFTPSGNPGNTITLNPHGSGSITNQKLLVYPTAGDGDHIHLTSGNLYQTELFLGSDNLFVKLANTGNIVINSDDNAGNTAQWKFGIDGNLTASGNLIIAGNTNVFGTDSALIQPTDDKPLLAISSGANGAVSSVWVEDIGNIGTSNIAAVYANPIPGSGIVRIAVGQNGGNAGPNLWDFNANGTTTFPGDLIGNGASPAPSINGFNSISSITLSASGNITGGNIIGNGNTLSNVATKVEGSWTLASGVNTVSINVPLNGTYTIWVNGNIPNGIVTYTATAVVTNTNVPVLGAQYGWYYAVGNALVLTSIPNQFTGTVGSISNVNTYAGNTANVFTFGITNNSGTSQVVNWGYTKL